MEREFFCVFFNVYYTLRFMTSQGTVEGLLGQDLSLQRAAINNQLDAAVVNASGAVTCASTLAVTGATTLTGALTSPLPKATVTNVTGNVTLVANRIYSITAAGAWTLTLPAAAAGDRIMVRVFVDGGANLLKLRLGASDTMTATVVLGAETTLASMKKVSVAATQALQVAASKWDIGDTFDLVAVADNKWLCNSTLVKAVTANVTQIA